MTRHNDDDNESKFDWKSLVWIWFAVIVFGASMGIAVRAYHWLAGR